MNSHFIWPLNKSITPDEMNTSFGPRIDADRWDFHDGIDLPAPLGTPVHAMADGVVHRAGPADKTGAGQGFGSTHVLLQVVDPKDGKDDLFLVHLHLDAIAQGVIPGAQVNQGDLIGTVGQEDASYPHLHFEFRKGGPEQSRSVHPLNYLPYLNTANFTQLRLDSCNFYRDDGDKRALRLRFAVRNRKEGDLQGVRVELRGEGIAARKLRVDFDDRETINSDKGDEHAFKNGIAVEGYQKSNLKGQRLRDLHYGVIVRDITPEYETVKLQVLDVRNEKPKSAEFSLPKLEAGEEPVNSRVGFEKQTFPPQGWELTLLPGNVCRADENAAHAGSQGLLCQDVLSLQGTLIRAGLRFALPARRMSWRLKADVRPAELEMSRGQSIHALAFLRGDDLLAAACLRKIRNDRYAAGVLIRSADGLLRERINVEGEGEILLDDWVRWELDLLRLGTRQTTAVLRLDGSVVARINGDTAVGPDTGCVGIWHRHSGLQITLHVDQLRLTEVPR
ncbi:MAG: M23 family metallopeptidase [Terrimicrobiaceae bacterium]